MCECALIRTMKLLLVVYFPIKSDVCHFIYEATLTDPPNVIHHTIKNTASPPVPSVLSFPCMYF